VPQVVYLCTGDSFAVTVHASGSNGMLGGTCSTLTASHLDKTVARMAWSFWARSDAYIVCCASYDCASLLFLTSVDTPASREAKIHKKLFRVLVRWCGAQAEVVASLTL